MIATALLLAACPQAQAADAPPIVVARRAVLPRGTPIQLMVLKEVNSRTARPGDRFRLRVNAPVVVEGVLAVPVGATAWGEVVSASGTGIAGGRGRLTMRIVELETPTGPVRLAGTLGQEGRGNTAGVAIGLLSFGLAGLLNKGGNATFKAGDIVVAEVDEGGQQPPLRPVN